MAKSKLQGLLFNRGISQRSLARELGVTPKTLSEKLIGKKDFRWREVVVICRQLNITNPLEIFPSEPILPHVVPQHNENAASER